MNTPAGPPPEPTNSARFNPSMAIIIVVLIGACLVVAIFSMYIRRCTQGGDESSSGSAVARRNQSIHFYERPGEGLDRAVIDSLPTVSFSVVKTLKSGKEDLECAVCLESFQEDESLRLLPKCSHVFHTECIDAWFLSHSTCPLCRTSLKPGTTGGVPAVGEVSRRILEAQEELFGSVRQAADQDSVIDEDQVTLDGSSREVGRDMERENERNSARLAMLRRLYRNSNSFRQAARGVEVRERLATLSARYPSFSTDAHVEPQGCIHLSLQRTGSSGEFHNSDVFRYGSQRYGTPGSSLRQSSSGRLTGTTTLNDQSIVKPSEEELAAEASTSSEHWNVTPDGGDLVTLPSDAIISSSAIPHTRIKALAGKDYASGKAWRVERGRSFRGLRSSFSLHRSASEGRAQMVEVEPIPSESAESDNSSSSLAQRTMQWLSGGSKHMTRGSVEDRNVALQQIVTE